MAVLILGPGVCSGGCLPPWPPSQQLRFMGYLTAGFGFAAQAVFGEPRSEGSIFCTGGTKVAFKLLLSVWFRVTMVVKWLRKLQREAGEANVTKGLCGGLLPAAFWYVELNHQGFGFKLHCSAICMKIPAGRAAEVL